MTDATNPSSAPDQNAAAQPVAPASGPATADASPADASETSDVRNLDRIRELNETIRYAMWSVFRAARALPASDAEREAMAAEVNGLLESLAEQDLVVRGCYDVAGLRADADLMFWWHAPTIEVAQRAYQGLRRTRLGSHLEPVWSAAALHRPAEFNRSHLPAFLAGEPARAYVCVYPFIRSYDWYVMEDAQRRAMLAEHGQMAREYGDVRANTIASFALNDYEWVLAFEADELDRIVDLMRHLRGAQARRHTRAEIPFFTGIRQPLADVVWELP